MKYLVLVPDGAADNEIESLGGKTPLEVADIPVMNRLASMGQVGLVATIPEGVAPGSDAANLSVMGYDPRIYLTGRSPLEAASIGIEMSDTDVAFRTNIITLSGEGSYEDLIIEDHSSEDITTAEADELIKAVNQAFSNDKIKFYTGVSYRHCMIVHDGSDAYQLTPPHDVLSRRVGDHLPKGEGSDFISDMMKKSYEILNNHPINISRRERGLNPGNSIWIWGQGKKPSLTSFFEKYGIKGAAISAVDLIKGIAILAGLESIDVEGATGTIGTNFEGKSTAAIKAFQDGQDLVYIHFEGPDECAHQGNLEGKIKCLEYIDSKALKSMIEYLEKSGEDFRVLIVPDHRTPMAIRTHSSDPVPYVIYDSTLRSEPDAGKQFNERSGNKGRFFKSGVELADYFFQKQQ